METVVEEHDERGSQSVSAKEDKGEDGNDLKDAFLDIEERDNSISESKSQNHGKSQVKIGKSASATSSIDIPAQSKLNKTQKMTDLKYMDVAPDTSMVSRTLNEDQINDMIMKS